jgi:8-oxo-dGTP pyrophosphatase MutT (NUDIX family)
MGIFRRVRERRVFENRWIELYDDEVLTPSGSPGTYVRLRYRDNPPGVVVVPRLDDARFLLLKAFRYALGAVSVEFPRGMADPGEDPEQAGRRELKEETGLTATRTVHLGVHCPDTSIVETRVHIVLARIESLDSLKLDTTVEGITDHVVMSAEELRHAVADGRILDGFTLGAYGLLCATGKLTL